ncbi:sulfotransferase [cf. Phormidesmis sp. LEGE 11477]|uniref:sulfotransferase n=1 Tax=cf. Phormidesmis sp. LEGE 11477 TaxID=1828680 RepID=UPI001880545E|nr:sulfotransferase [cf. Phormidesmis sp. LEGE 11477]MBE9063154.1 sulfotransferase [cf. Phormidesmis sp. LEGE 11477]
MSSNSSITQNKDSEHTQLSSSSAALKAFQYSIPIEYNVIFGCPRSGTTFLFEALNALPRSECSSGHLFPLALAHLVNRNLSPDIYQCIANSFEFSIQDYLEAVYGNRVTSIHKWLSQSMSTKEMFQSLKGQRRIKRFVYKEPFLAFSPELVYNALPACRIIHIYRDGRDCADSLARKYKVLTDEKLMTLKTAEMPMGRKYDHRYVPWWVEVGKEEEFLGYTPYIRSIWMWKEMVRRCRDFLERSDVIASGRILTIKYEDLVRSPLEYGEQAVNHFRCEMTDQLRAKFKAARQSSVNIHKRRDPEELKLAEKVAQTELAQYGYL